MLDHAALRALLRTDLTAFVEKCFHTLEPGTPYEDNWHIQAITHALMKVWRGESKRLIINVPPRMMKSIAVTIAFSAWVLGHDPRKRVITVTYAREFAKKHAADFRTIVESAWFQALFPDLRIQRKRDRDVEIVTTEQGYRFAGSIKGGVLGRGADLILIDDPIKPLDALSQAERTRVAEAYGNSIYTRLNSKREGAIVIIMQRLHEEDLVGAVLQKEDWDVLSIPAIAPERAAYQVGPELADVYVREAGEVLHPAREGREELDAIRRNLGSLTFAAQYQQNPLPIEGNIIKRSRIKYYEEAPEEVDRILVSWDTASTLAETSDYSVGTVWGALGQDYFLLHVMRGRYEVPELRRRIVALSDRYGATATLIEETELGRAITQDLRSTGALRPILQRSRVDKLTRLLAQSARFEAGQVYLPREAPWLASYVGELLAFPNGRHDDQVDSTSQALQWLTVRSPQERVIVRRDIVRRDVVRSDIISPEEARRRARERARGAEDDFDD